MNTLVKVGDFVIAQRHSIIVVEEDIKINLRDTDSNGSASDCASGSGDDCAGAIRNREIVYKLRFMHEAWQLYDELEEYLGDICATNKVMYQRRIGSRTTLEYLIASAYIEPTDMLLEWQCPGIKTGIVHLITSEEDETTEIASAGYTVLKPVN